MRELAALRKEMAKTDPSKNGGRPRTRYTKKEAEARALERMVPKALKVLETQLDSVDQRVQQSAAVKVLEYTKGKPVQQIQQQVHQIAEIRYEAAAWDPMAALGQGFPVIDSVAIEIDEEDLPALPEAPEEGYE